MGCKGGCFTVISSTKQNDNQNATENTKSYGCLFFLLIGFCLFVLKGKQKTGCKIIPLALGRETVRQELAQGSANSWKS